MAATQNGTRRKAPRHPRVKILSRYFFKLLWLPREAVHLHNAAPFSRGPVSRGCGNAELCLPTKALPAGVVA